MSAPPAASLPWTCTAHPAAAAAAQASAGTAVDAAVIQEPQLGQLMALH
jgi:hypothetical protein